MYVSQSTSISCMQVAIVKTTTNYMYFSHRTTMQLYTNIRCHKHNKKVPENGTRQNLVRITKEKFAVYSYGQANYLQDTHFTSI